MTTPAQDQTVTTVDAAETDPNVVLLDQPVQRGAQLIERITLRKPNAGELRGVSLSDLLNLEVTAIIKVLPRISQPSLTDNEVRSMDPADLAEVGGRISVFLLKKALKEEAFRGM